MAGRAGRRGLDATSTVIILAKGPEIPDIVSLRTMLKVIFATSFFRQKSLFLGQSRAAGIALPCDLRDVVEPAQSGAPEDRGHALKILHGKDLPAPDGGSEGAHQAAKRRHRGSAQNRVCYMLPAKRGSSLANGLSLQAEDLCPGEERAVE